MKTKAYKLKENIARYMYNYIDNENVSIYFGKFGEKNKWFIYPGMHYFCYIPPIISIEEKRCSLIDILGLDIRVTGITYERTLLWNKEKEEKWKKGRIVKFPNKKEKFYLVQTDTDVFGLYRNLDEAETLKMHLEIVLGKKVYIEKIN